MGSRVLRIGTSGWQYDHWRELFYPRALAKAKWFEYYAAHFRTVEVNNTFYRLPKPETFCEWARRAPDGFEFVLKASNYLTHMRRLRDPEEPVTRLLTHAAGLGSHLAAVLLQLPPDMKAAPERLDATLSEFARRSQVRVAVEPRHRSWWNDEVRAVLTERGAALCWADRDSRLVTPQWNTAGWVYLRLHAGRAQPPSCYGPKALSTRACQVHEVFGPDADGYVFFNNDGHGCALRDAASFARRAAAAGLTTT